MRWILLLLPWAELYGLIQLGGRIGGLMTILYVFATLVLGMSIIRAQGMEIVARLREAQGGGMLAGRLLADDVAVGLGGVLLAVPGIFTDALALAVLLGPLWRRLTGQSRPAGRGAPHGSPGGADVPPRGPEVIDGEFRRIDDENP